MNPTNVVKMRAPSRVVRRTLKSKPLLSSDENEDPCAAKKLIKMKNEDRPALKDKTNQPLFKNTKDVSHPTSQKNKVCIGEECKLSDRNQHPSRLLDNPNRPSNVYNLDAHGDLTYCPEYGHAITANLMRQELGTSIDPSKMTITDKDRAIVIEWMIELHHGSQAKTETLWCATNIFDLYLTLHTVSKSHLQVIGSSSLFTFFLIAITAPRRHLSVHRLQVWRNRAPLTRSSRRCLWWHLHANRLFRYGKEGATVYEIRGQLSSPSSFLSQVNFSFSLFVHCTIVKKVTKFHSRRFLHTNIDSFVQWRHHLWLYIILVRPFVWHKSDTYQILCDLPSDRQKELQVDFSSLRIHSLYSFYVQISPLTTCRRCHLCHAEIIFWPKFRPEFSSKFRSKMRRKFRPKFWRKFRPKISLGRKFDFLHGLSRERHHRVFRSDFRGTERTR